MDPDAAFIAAKRAFDASDKNDADFRSKSDTLFSEFIKKRDRDVESYNLDVHEPRGFVPPSQYDVLLTDVTVHDVRQVLPQVLDVGFLSETTPSNDLGGPIPGRLFGSNQRPFANLVITLNQKTLNVFFFVDTGAAQTFLCKETLDAFQVSGSVGNFVFRRERFNYYISPSDSHFGYLNLLGADFLRQLRAQLHVDYDNLELRIAPKSPETRER